MPSYWLLLMYWICANYSPVPNFKKAGDGGGGGENVSEKCYHRFYFIELNSYERLSWKR